MLLFRELKTSPLARQIDTKFTDVDFTITVETPSGSIIKQSLSGLNLTGLVGTNFTAGTWCEGANILQSGTKEWGVSRRLKYCWIDTAKTKFVGNELASLPISLTNLKITELTAGAALFITSLDDLPLTTSKHMLIGMVGDAKNSGMTFTDNTERTLSTTGDYPILVSDCVARMRLNSIPKGVPCLYPLNRTGERASDIPVSLPVDPTGIYIDIRNSGSTTVFWELVIS